VRRDIESSADNEHNGVRIPKWLSDANGQDPVVLRYGVVIDIIPFLWMIVIPHLGD
jgi:hypothetical protein